VGVKAAFIVELWVDDHQEYEPGIVTGHRRHVRIPLDPRPGEYLVVGDDEVPPALALVHDGWPHSPPERRGGRTLCAG
jgi:hypothetical protein